MCGQCYATAKTEIQRLRAEVQEFLPRVDAKVEQLSEENERQDAVIQRARDVIACINQGKRDQWGECFYRLQKALEALDRAKVG